jgi:hypothetical protein
VKALENDALGAGVNAPNRVTSSQRNAASSSQDTRGEVRGKVVHIDRTKKQRRHVITRFRKWAEERREPFLKRPLTEIARDYLEHEVALGRKATTINGGTYPYLLLFGEWLADRGVCERPNRGQRTAIVEVPHE